MTIHSDTLQPLPQGTEGEICLSGPSIFNQYLTDDQNILSHPSCFIEIEGKRWFKTGDIGYLKNQTVFISGRLKRFTKIAGEMLSLESIEYILAQEFKEQNRLSFAISVDDSIPDDPKFVLFTTSPIEKEEVNAILKKAGLSPLIKMNSVKVICEIPLMGSGKIDYPLLQKLARTS